MNYFEKTISDIGLINALRSKNRHIHTKALVYKGTELIQVHDVPPNVWLTVSGAEVFEGTENECKVEFKEKKLKLSINADDELKEKVAFLTDIKNVAVS